MKKLLAIGVVALCQFVAGLDGRAQQFPTTVQPPPSLELRIRISQAVVQTGQSVRLHIELHNTGQEDFFVGQYLFPFKNAPSFLDLQITDVNGGRLGFEEWTGTWSPRALEEWWTRIAPGHSYGYTLEIDANTEDFLSKPGKYSIRARYVSKGGWTIVGAGKKASKRRVWHGEITSNEVDLEVVALSPAPK